MVFLLAGLALAALANAQKEEPPQLLLEKATKLELVDGDLKGVIATDERILALQGVPRTVAARALLHLGECHEKLGHAEARKAYERLVRDFADQTEEAGRARARLAALGESDRALKVRQVWAGPHDDFLGAPTRDGRYLTLQDWDSQDLAVRDLSTGQKRRLTHKDPGLRVRPPVPAFAGRPGGRLRLVQQGPVLRPADRGNGWLQSSRPLRQRSRLEWVEPTDWSPDGKSILAVLEGRDKKNQIAQIAVKDGAVRVLKAFDQHAPRAGTLLPGWPFRRLRLPIRGLGAEEHDVFLLAVDGGGVPLWFSTRAMT